MASTAATGPQVVNRDGLENYLISMARTVNISVSWALASLVNSTLPDAHEGPGDIFLLEPRINEMEIVIDDRAVRMLRDERLSEIEVRRIVATLKITNDLERMGDLAVNLAERVVSLAGMQAVAPPPELAPMVAATGAMVEKALSALMFRNVELAIQVLESDDLVDRYRDQIFERLMTNMTEHPVNVAPNLQLVLASRYLERLADHATNIAEDIIFWVRGLDVRHGNARNVTEDSQPRDVLVTGEV